MTKNPKTLILVIKVALFLQKLLRQRSLQAITEAVKKGGYSASEAGVTGLRHFLYKARRSCQFTSPRYEAPYNNSDSKHRLFTLYQCVHARTHAARRPLKILYHVGTKESIIGWVSFKCATPSPTLILI